MSAKLIDTRVEERDGATWITGLCPFCWERVAVRDPSVDSTATARCPNGHLLHIDERHSSGESAPIESPQSDTVDGEASR
ncbi:MAG: hypothetical protein ABSC94_22660 [Polyangiaceae bacterium]